MVRGFRHLGWIPAGGAVGFAASYVFTDLLPLPTDLYYLVYFGAVAAFLVLYARATDLDLTAWASRRATAAVLLGLAGGAVLAAGVLARPASPTAGGSHRWWDLLWRGLIYGSVDGVLLYAFPWVVVWRALGAEVAGWRRKTGAALVAWVAILLVTTLYHLGYADFRSEKILQPNIGSTIGAVPTLVSANPLASPLAHVVLHATAVLHAPGSDLYLPPHPERRAGPTRISE